MALTPITPRDRLQRLVDLGRKAIRFWWLVALFAVLGGALSFAFAMTRPKAYQSWATVFYQERIQSSLLQNREETTQRNIGDRYRELLMARDQLESVIADKATNPFPEIKDTEVAIDKLRQAVRFEARGANAFRISYTDSDPDRAKAITDKLTKALGDKDEALRNDQAQRTVKFAISQKDQASSELVKQEQELAGFLAKHPEFAQDTTQQQEGASIRAIKNQKVTPTGQNARLYALERQRQRIQARLDANPDAPRTPSAPSAARLAAEQVVTDATRELAAAQRELEDALARYTELHPAVKNAKEKVAAAQAKVRKAKAELPDDTESVAPATPQDRAKLAKDLQAIESAIAAEQQASAAKTPTAAATAAAADASTNWVVALETEHAKLRRQVAEAREKMQSLNDSVFRAQIDANEKLAEDGGRLTVIDPAFKPVRPSGPGKTIFLMAGMVLFLSLGFALAIGLAVIDDRLYRRTDVDALGVAVLAVIPPARARRKK